MVRFVEAESRMGVAGVCREGKGEDHGYRALVLQEDSVLETCWAAPCL